MSDEDFGRRATRAAFATRALLLVVAMLLIAVFWLLVEVTTDTNRIVEGVEAQQDLNSGYIANSKDTLDRVVDCTEPGGKCFNEGAERTAEAVGNIGRLSVYAAACAADRRLVDQTLEERADEIEKCVTQLIERK